MDECLVAYLHDTQDAWQMDSDGSYTRVQVAKPKKGSTKPEPSHGAQAALMALHSAKM
jgi:polyphosphate kinase